MNPEAKIGANEIDTDSQIGLYVRAKIKDALSKNADYALKHEEQLKESGYEGYMPLPIEVKIGNADYQEVVSRRYTRVLGRVIREHEMMILTRKTQDGEVKVQLNTTQGETESMGKILLFRDNKRFEGEDALDLIDSSFPELFPQES